MASGKAQWIGDTFTYFAGRGVKLVIRFNEDKETDWAVFGGTGGVGDLSAEPLTDNRHRLAEATRIACA